MEASYDYEESVVLVTGVSGALGSAIAEAFDAAGATVCGADTGNQYDRPLVVIGSFHASTQRLPTEKSPDGRRPDSFTPWRRFMYKDAPTGTCSAHKRCRPCVSSPTAGSPASTRRTP